MDTQTKRIHSEKRQVQQCRICGDDTFYSFFGTISCHACKMFFKRHAEQKHTHSVCQSKGYCQVNRETRSLCIACRLKKCFDCGMTVDRLRPWRFAKGSLVRKRRTSKYDLPVTVAPMSIKKLSQRDVCLLTNLINNIDLSTTLLIADHLNQTKQNFQGIVNVTPRWKVLVRALVTEFYQMASMAFRKNKDFQLILSSDRSILLLTSIDNMVRLSAVYILFRTQLYQDETLLTYLRTTYGDSAIVYLLWALKSVQIDSILFKLAIGLFSLSSANRSFQTYVNDELVDVKSILEIENRYVEVTWKYLLYKYSFREAIEQYLKVIRCLNDMVQLAFYSQSAVQHINDLQSMVEQTEISLVLDDVDQMK